MTLITVFLIMQILLNPVTRVTIPQVMDYPVKQQAGDEIFEGDIVTQYRHADLGLIAHNTQAGKKFSQIVHGDEVIITRGDNTKELFTVWSIQMYERLPYGMWRSLNTGEEIGNNRLFERVYGGAYHLTLQTCIMRGEDYEWGRLFILAYEE